MASTILPRVATGEQAAMNDCLDRYGGLVWSIVNHGCSNRADAEEVVQDVFLDIWKSASRFDPAVANESTFVAMIARRRVIDRRRKQQRTVAAGSLQDESSATNDVFVADRQVTALAELADEAARAREKMSELKEAERSVLELAIDHGLSHSQIAERTEMPLGTVKTHARRGLLRLREMLSGAKELKGGVS